MAPPEDALAAALQTGISELEKEISSRLADAQLPGDEGDGKYHELKDTVDGLQGQIDQLDGVLNGLSNDSAQFTADIIALQADAQAQTARIGRRASRRDLDATSAALDQLRTKVIGIPDQIKEISRVLQNVQGQVSSLRECGNFQDPASEVLITDVPMSDNLELFEDTYHSRAEESESSAEVTPAIADESANKAAQAKMAKTFQNIRNDDHVGEMRPSTSQKTTRVIAPQSAKPANKKVATMSATTKQTAKNNKPISTFLTTSQIRRSVATESDSTVKASTPMQERRSNVRRPAPSQSGSASSAFPARATERLSMSVADSDDEDTEEGGDVEGEVSNEAELVRSSVETNEEVRERPITPDTRQVTRMDRDLYRNFWHAEGRPGSLDDYVRQHRPTVNIDDGDGPRTRVKTPIDYKQSLLPKTRMTRAPRAKRPTDSDEEVALQGDAPDERRQKKQKRTSANELLKSFQSPTKKTSDVKAAK